MENIESRIIKKLQEINIDYNLLESFLKEYLIRIEKIIISKEQAQSEAIKALKTTKFNPSSISKELNCSRTTLYSYGGILKRYIETSVQYYNANNPYEEIESLKADIIRLDKQIKMMMERDIETELLSAEVDTHLNTIKEKNNEIERLNERNAMLNKEVRELRKLSLVKPSNT